MSKTDSATIKITAFSGTRDPLETDKQMLVTIVNDQQTVRYQRSYPQTSIQLVVPFHNGPGDTYAVTAWIDGFEQSGFPTVAVDPDTPQEVDLMLVPQNSRFKFFEPDLAAMSANPDTNDIATLLTGTDSIQDAGARYQQLLDSEQPSLACFFNITEAMSQIHLPQGTVLDYMKAIIWDDPKAQLAQDRFFAYADKTLIKQVSAAATGQNKIFAQDPDPGAFHPGATLSFKQIQFGEANVQLTFHENDPVPDPAWVKIEPDIDYFRDLPAHGLLEVLPNTILHKLTDPKEVYALRWIAGRRAGVPEFNPPYWLE